MTMRYRVGLKRSDEGVAAWVPGLPGCWSQGRNAEEALANIGEAIREYVAVAEELVKGGETREIGIAV